MIPKKIHYCWFGGNPKPKLAKKCIKSWKKYCKGYEIIEWNESNFDISSAPLYVRQAYENKKWAFVTDYVRLWAMVNYGGIYMDTDVEVIKPLDRFLEHDAFSGFESQTGIPTGIMASCRDFSLFNELLREYYDIKFINDDGSQNLETNVVKITSLCSKYGFVANGLLQTIHGFTLYPKEYFCPLDCETFEMNRTNNTYTIHHFAGSWVSPEYKKKQEEQIENKKNEKKVIKKKQRIYIVKHIPNFLLSKILGKKIYNNIKAKLKR